MMSQRTIVHNLNKIKESLFVVFVNKPLYLLSAGLIAFFIFGLFIFVTNMPIFIQAWKVTGFALFPAVTLDIINTILSVSGILQLVLMVAIAVMGGINISMIIFKFLVTRNVDGINFTSFGGLVGSTFGAGCPACSTSLLSILGVSGGLSVLPFKGVEITSLGLLVLVISFYFTSRSISECEKCKIS
ncbi:MAG: hypothetical protein HYW22_02910 [Candidatus Aenigmarchaeota archaeon]|nr:hypothetical protein [Candidatus Aenigmarchaeota archaeon]